MKKISLFITLMLLCSSISPVSTYAETRSIDDNESDVINNNDDSENNNEDAKKVNSNPNEHLSSKDNEEKHVDKNEDDLDKKRVQNKQESNEDDSSEVEKEKQDSPKNKSPKTKVNKDQVDVKEKDTDKLGHIKSSNAIIYKEIGDTSTSFSAGNSYMGKVYYIKKKASVNGSVYYLLSKEASSTKGVIGWIKKSDVTWHTRTVIDWDKKVFYAKGSGKGYKRAWGGEKEVKQKSLSQNKGEKFTVEVTVQVGKQMWYRGKIGGKTVWIHMDDLVSKEEKDTDKLGHIKNSNATIYKEIGDTSTSFSAGNSHMGKVYYIKKKASVGGNVYYLLSKEASSTKGVIGWIKKSDVTWHSRKVIDWDKKVFYAKGSGKGYKRAWGGEKEVKQKSLSQNKGEKFTVEVTVQVGKQMWYRGKIGGKTVWIHMDDLVSKEEKDTDKLGHIKSSNAIIYKEIGDTSTSFSAGNSHMGKVYYIKKKASVGENVYYLLSKEASSTKGVIGWIKKSDVTWHTRAVIDWDKKVFYAKGSGKGYKRAWGGEKEVKLNKLSKYKEKKFTAEVTVRVGNQIWYRGKIGGKTVWIHTDNLSTEKEKNTDKLGHIQNSDAIIYREVGNDSTTFPAGNSLMNKVYYIKKKISVGGNVYYLLSKEASSTKGVIGWIKKSDVTWHTRTVIDWDKKVFYAKGNGKGYKRAWGGDKEVKLSNLSKYKGKKFTAEVTVQVGKQLWYRGKIGGITVWIHESYLTDSGENFTKYSLTLDEALNIQMKASPQTDKYTQYVSSKYVKYNKSGGYYYVDADVLNVRKGPGTAYAIVDKVYNGERLSISKKEGNWYKLYFVDAKRNDVKHYLNPKNFINDSKQKLQFLDLSKSSDAPARVLNDYLKGKGKLSGQGQAFIDAGKKHGVNDIYLISHAILETGNGTSKLSTGVKHKDKTVYNMFGIGAYDGCAVECGAKKAYEEGWTTPYKAIVGGSKFIGNEYIKGQNGENRALNTLYKMRWNPGAMQDYGRFGKQYATDIGWAAKQVDSMFNIYQKLDSYTLYLDIPNYK